MKKINIILIYVFILFFSSCQKQSILEKETPQVYRIFLSGNTNTELELLFRDKVVATSLNQGGIAGTIYLNTFGLENPEIIIREKISQKIVGARKIDTSKYYQELLVFYEDGKIYSDRIYYKINGFVLSGDLEFLLDGKLIYEGTSKIELSKTILIDGENSRKLEIRKKGETEILLTENINPKEKNQSISFFFDGKEMVKDIKMDPPKNPNNMAISVQFKSTFNNPNSADLFFQNKSEIDLIAFTRKKGKENTSRGTPEIRVEPEIRLTIPTNGTFVNFELPPLEDQTLEYSFDILEKGTNNIPYILGTNSLSIYGPVGANQGRFGSGIIVTPGKSKLLSITDATRTSSLPKKHQLAYIKITDLSDYLN